MQLTKNIGGKDMILETGTYAHLADGAVTVTVGETVVLVIATMGKDAKPDMDFFPLFVEYQERMYATGKIKGSRFIKREGRPSDQAILSGRVIDRAIRPMFPDGMRNDVQVVVHILSGDMENDPDIFGLIGASAALNIGGIPFEKPIAGVRIGLVDGNLIVNPTYEQIENGDLDLVVAGSEDSINMVEAGANEVDDETMLKAMDLAHEEIKKMCAFQKEFIEENKKQLKEVELFTTPEEVKNEVISAITNDELEGLYGHMKEEYQTRENAIKERILEQFADKIGIEELNEWTTANVMSGIKSAIKKHMRKNILENGKRLDGRTPEEIRALSSKIDVLPRPHGSAIFQRGDTQALSVVTLGAPGDAQIVDEMDEDLERRYMHHYNFPPYSTGEVGFFRGAGRREIGHGYLAERAITPVLPSKDEFPYTIRVVSEIMTCNGSTSMASTCGSTLSLMAAGVPIKAPVSGIAMGVIVDEETGKYVVLSDIQGTEDFLGDMDFKVTGTKKGITALQLDMKVKGMKKEILEAAIKQGNEGRDFILNSMMETISEPKSNLSKYAPVLLKMNIDPDKIRDVIGKGGETIQGIMKECGNCSIDIDDDGLVVITADNSENGEKAKNMVSMIVYEPEAGDVIEGKVMRIEAYGIFVQLTPKLSGLVHISKVKDSRTEPDELEKLFKIGQSLKVKIEEIDNEGRYNLTLKGL